MGDDPPPSANIDTIITAISVKISVRLSKNRNRIRHLHKFIQIHVMQFLIDCYTKIHLETISVQGVFCVAELYPFIV